MKRAMIDIETLSTEPDAAVIAIGTVIFTETTIIDTQEILINPVLATGHRSKPTMEWWENQNSETREKMMSGTSAPWVAYSQWLEFLLPHPVKEIWANAPSFDLSILRSSFKACGLDFPLHYSKERDFRTLTALARGLGIDYSGLYEKRVPHSALSDAVTQAKVVQMILHNIKMAFSIA